LCPACEGKGYFEGFYTLPGGIIRSLSFGGLVALVMVITDTIWMPIVYGMPLGILGYFIPALEGKFTIMPIGNVLINLVQSFYRLFLTLNFF